MKYLYKKFLILMMSLMAISLSAQSNPKELPAGFEEMLHHWSRSFLTKVSADYADTLNLHVKDDNTYFHVIFAGGDYRIVPEKNPHARITLTSTLGVYSKIFNGELNAMTAIGREVSHQPAPLDMILENGMNYRKIDWKYAYFTLINFFNPHPHNKSHIGRSYARKIHGGHAVALYYSPGYRSAFYHLAQGETLNEAGEKDLFNQSFIIIGGNGYALLGDEVFEIKANEAYYIKPGIAHKIWTDSDEGVSLIWNAWGEKVW
jgi:mannose-6-phosphate isomerase-like protein (cupin superfamily)